MVDQTLVQTGFDIEVLLSARYVTYALLAQIEAGLLPMAIEIVDPAQGVDVRVDLRPPTDYERRYEPDPAAVLPPAADGSFATEFVFGDPDGANLMLSVVTDILDRTTGDVRSGVTIGLMLGRRSRGRRRRSWVRERSSAVDQPREARAAHGDPARLGRPRRRRRDGEDQGAAGPYGDVRCGERPVRAGARLSVLDGGNGRPPAMGVYINWPSRTRPRPTRSSATVATSTTRSTSSMTARTSPSLRRRSSTTCSETTSSTAWPRRPLPTAATSGIRCVRYRATPRARSRERSIRHRASRDGPVRGPDRTIAHRRGG